jgi:hypothetical protein
MSMPEELHDDLEKEGVHESEYYGILPGIGGVIIGFLLIAIMFALADGFA